MILLGGASHPPHPPSPPRNFRQNFKKNTLGTLFSWGGCSPPESSGGWPPRAAGRLGRRAPSAGPRGEDLAARSSPLSGTQLRPGVSPGLLSARGSPGGLQEPWTPGILDQESWSGMRSLRTSNSACALACTLAAEAWPGLRTEGRRGGKVPQERRSAAAVPRTPRSVWLRHLQVGLHLGSAGALR